MVFKEEIREPLQLVLLVLVVLYFAFGQLDEALTAFVVLMAAVALEVLNQYRAKKAVESLSTHIKIRKSTVLRDGQIQYILSEEIAIGDILVLERPGDRIGADGRLILSIAF